MKKGFEEEFNIKLKKGILTDEELDLTEKFERECFSDKKWNHKR